VITATAHYSVDPEASVHRSIVDLDLAPRDSDGVVRFNGDVEILRPVDGGRRRLFFDWGQPREQEGRAVLLRRPAHEELP
jgi:hypothetical protein